MGAAELASSVRERMAADDDISCPSTGAQSGVGSRTSVMARLQPGCPSKGKRPTVTATS